MTISRYYKNDLPNIIPQKELEIEKQVYCYICKKTISFETFGYVLKKYKIFFCGRRCIDDNTAMNNAEDLIYEYVSFKKKSEWVEEE